MIYSTTDADYAVAKESKPCLAVPPFCSIYYTGHHSVLLISAQLHRGVLFGAGKCNMTYDSDKNIITLIPTVDGKMSVIYSNGRIGNGSQIISLNTFIRYCNIKDTPYGRHPAKLLPDGSIEVDLNNLI